MNLLYARLNYHQRRWYAAVEANRVGQGGSRAVTQILGTGKKVIERGRAELVTGLPSIPRAKYRTKPTGRPKVEEKDLTLVAAMDRLVCDETAGDPMKEHKYVRSSVSQLHKRLTAQGYSISRSTVYNLLLRMGFSMKTNVKKRGGYAGNREKRDEQFVYLAARRREFTTAGLPVISVDAKKKELIGDFKQSGRAWCKEVEEVDKYDFPSLAECRATPFGIYDVAKNQGFVYVGTSGNTPAFAVDAISRWWREEGKNTYPQATELLIMADGGGSNGWRSRAWRQLLQINLCDELGLTVTVCHYPTRCSHWNPIERMLFTQISINWAGKPLRTLDIMLGYIRGTTTKTGLSVKAFLQEGDYEKGQRVTKAEMDALSLQAHAVCPDWNYTIHSRCALDDPARQR